MATAAPVSTLSTIFVSLVNTSALSGVVFLSPNGEHVQLVRFAWPVFLMFSIHPFGCYLSVRKSFSCTFLECVCGCNMALLATIVTNHIQEMTILRWKHGSLFSELETYWMLADGSFKAFAFWSAASMVCAMSKPFTNVSSFSAIRHFCVLSFWIPQMKRSFSALSRRALNSHLVDIHLNSAA